MPFTIKICGLKEAADLEAAIEAGADAVGFMAYAKSKRFIDAGRLAALLKGRSLRNVRKVGVFVDPSIDELKRYIDAGIDVIQLHGSETPGVALEAAKLAEVWKAFGPKTREDVEAFAGYPAKRLLVDACSPLERGGTGLKADWSLARFAVARLLQGVILAGGLTPENVAEAIAEVRPSGVDVSSGVESAPGVKDAGLIRAFVKAAKKAASELTWQPEAGKA